MNDSLDFEQGHLLETEKKSLKVTPFLFGVQSSGTAKSTSDYTIIRSTMCTKKLTMNYVDLFSDGVHTRFT